VATRRPKFDSSLEGIYRTGFKKIPSPVRLGFGVRFPSLNEILEAVYNPIGLVLRPVLSVDSSD
jgi:hypothetical protein